MAALKGIDISHHNGFYIKHNHVSLSDIAREGFVIMKATEGVTWNDPARVEYLREIGELSDKQIGFYHYARAEQNEPRKEALNFLAAVKNYVGKAMFALDVEQKSLSLPGDALDLWVISWLNTFEKESGVKPLVYIQRSAMKRLSSVARENYGLWLPAWQTKKPRNPEPWPFIAIWQYDCIGLDKNIFYGSKEQWHRYAEAH